MKVLMISQDYPPKIYAGIGRHVGALTRALRSYGSDVTVVTTTWLNPPGADADPQTIRADRSGPPVPKSDGAHVWSPVDMLQFNISMAAEAVQQTGFDVVHCHDMFSVLAGSVAARTHGCPLIMTKHFILESLEDRVFPGLDRPLSADERQLYQYSVDLQRWSIDQADQIICVSQWTAEAVAAIAADASRKTVTIHNGTDLHTLVSHEVALPDIANRQPQTTILYAGRLRWKKGADVLLHALSGLQGLNWKLIVAGDGEYRPQLEALAEELGLSSRVQFQGFIEANELAQAYLDADVVVVPSREEPFGLVASEAMSLGRLVIASRLGGLAEQITHGVNGLLFAPGDPEDLRRQILWGLEHPAAAADLATQARLFALERLTWDAVARQTTVAYEAAMASNKGNTITHV